MVSTKTRVFALTKRHVGSGKAVGSNHRACAEVCFMPCKYFEILRNTPSVLVLTKRHVGSGNEIGNTRVASGYVNKVKPFVILFFLQNNVRKIQW